MTQQIALSATLSPATAGQAIGYAIHNIDGTVYAAFTTTGVVEGEFDGAWMVTALVNAPDGGGTAYFGTAGNYVAQSPIPPSVANAVNTVLATAHGAGSWATATGYSTHSAANVVTAMQAVADDFKADVSGLATASALTAVANQITALGATAAITVVSIVSGGTFTPTRGDTWRIPMVTLPGWTLTNYEALAFAVKRSTDNTDGQSALLIRTDDGLTHISGAPIASPVLSTDGVLTVTGATTFSLLVHMPATSLVPDHNYTWWLKGFDDTSPDEGYTLATGAFNVQPWGVRATE